MGSLFFETDLLLVSIAVILRPVSTSFHHCNLALAVPRGNQYIDQATV